MVMSSKKIGKMVTADVDKALANIGSTRPDMKDAGAELKAAAAPQKAQTFAEAFRAARKDPEAMKRGTFTFGGKSFSTKMAGEGASRPTTSRPSAPAATTSARPATPASPAPAATRAQIEAKRTAARSQAAIRDKRAENQADFRERMQAKRATASKGPVNAGRSEGFLSRFAKSDIGKEYAERQKKKYGYKKGGSVDGCAVRGKTRAPMKKGK